MTNSVELAFVQHVFGEQSYLQSRFAATYRRDDVDNAWNSEGSCDICESSGFISYLDVARTYIQNIITSSKARMCSTFGWIHESAGGNISYEQAAVHEHFISWRLPWSAASKELAKIRKKMPLPLPKRLKLIAGSLRQKKGFPDLPTNNVRSIRLGNPN